ncbi:hypothetical protein GQ44DRAFT_173324 [Phaeosphaeriaceae sp. PMI808]|nr:hypothetical protein GQ44DRAFT_173324 [Phaeosphaeriaceae sp. PMI808]
MSSQPNSQNVNSQIMKPTDRDMLSSMRKRRAETVSGMIHNCSSTLKRCGAVRRKTLSLSMKDCNETRQTGLPTNHSSTSNDANPTPPQSQILTTNHLHQHNLPTPEYFPNSNYRPSTHHKQHFTTYSPPPPYTATQTPTTPQQSNTEAPLNPIQHPQTHTLNFKFRHVSPISAILPPRKYTRGEKLVRRFTTR